MLAIARALMSRPRLLLCDEPSLGLAPIIVQELFAILAAPQRGARASSVLLVEQNANLAMEIAHRAYLLETGTHRRVGRRRDDLATTTPSARPTSGTEGATWNSSCSTSSTASRTGSIYALLALGLVDHLPRHRATSTSPRARWRMFATFSRGGSTTWACRARALAWPCSAVIFAFVARAAIEWRSSARWRTARRSRVVVADRPVPRRSTRSAAFLWVHGRASLVPVPVPQRPRRLRPHRRRRVAHRDDRRADRRAACSPRCSSLLFQKTKFGLAMRAVASNPDTRRSSASDRPGAPVFVGLGGALARSAGRWSRRARQRRPVDDVPRSSSSPPPRPRSAASTASLGAVVGGLAPRRLRAMSPATSPSASAIEEPRPSRCPHHPRRAPREAAGPVRLRRGWSGSDARSPSTAAAAPPHWACCSWPRAAGALRALVPTDGRTRRSSWRRRCHPVRPRRPVAQPADRLHRADLDRPLGVLRHRRLHDGHPRRRPRLAPAWTYPRRLVCASSSAA